MTHRYYIAKARTITSSTNILKEPWEYCVRPKYKIENDNLKGNYKTLEEIAEKVSFALDRIVFISDPTVYKEGINFYTSSQTSIQHSCLSEREFGLLANFLAKVPLDKQVKSIVKSY